MSAWWSDGLREVNVIISRPEQKPQLMDASKPELYDVRLYEIPWADTVPPEASEAGFYNPVFALEDLSEEIVASRIYEVDDAGDVDGYRINFGVWYEDAGVLVEYDAKGLTAEQARELILND